MNRLNPATVLYGTGEQHYSSDSLYGDGLFRTVDGGANWSKIALKSQVGNYIARVDISPGLLHVCSDFGYVRSDTDGASWAAFKPAGTAWCNDLVRSAQAPQTMFAAFYGRGIYKSIDNGQSWTQLAGGLPSFGFQRINLAIADSNADVVYASFIAPSGSLAGMYKTVNGGTSWSLLSSTPNYACSQGWYDNGMVVSPIDANTVYAGGVFWSCSGGIAKTTNGGTTWTYVTVGSDFTQVHPDQHYFVFGPDGALWVACDGGAWKTITGGSTWVNLNNGLNTALLYTVGIHPSDSSFLVAGTQDNGTVQFQGGLAWPQVIGGDGGPVAVEWANPNRYFTTYVRLSPMYRWLRPISYQGTVTGPWSGDRASWANGPLIVDPNLPNTLLAGTYRVWQTTNSGSNWTAISADLTTGGHLRGLAIAPLDSNIIYSGSSDGLFFATFDRGANWQLRNAGLPGTRTISDIIVSPADPLIVYFSVDQSSGGRLFQSFDGGLTWGDKTGSLAPGIRAMSLAIDFATNTIYLGTDYGVYATHDTGMTWAQEALNLPSVAVYDAFKSTRSTGGSSWPRTVAGCGERRCGRSGRFHLGRRRRRRVRFHRRRGRCRRILGRCDLECRRSRSPDSSLTEVRSEKVEEGLRSRVFYLHPNFSLPSALARGRDRTKRREVLEDFRNLFVHALVTLLGLRRLMDALCLEATPEQRAGLRVLHVNRQRAAEFFVHIAATVPAVISVSTPIRTIRRAEVRVFHLVAPVRRDEDIGVAIGALHPACLELSGDSRLRALPHERAVVLLV